MQKLSITNFGPIDKIILDVEDCLLFIGPQASGKSTIAKAIYFFKSLKEDLLKYIIEATENSETLDKPYKYFEKIIISKFVGFWGTAKHLSAFEISYDFGKGKTIILTLHDGYVKSVLSDAFHKELSVIFDKAIDFQTINIIGISQGKLSKNIKKQAFYKQIEELSNNLFEDNSIPIYIPAGRSILSSISATLLTRIAEQERNQEANTLLDTSLIDFIERINNLKPAFTKDFEDLIKDKENFTDAAVNIKNVQLAIQIIDKILRGRYRYDKEGEKMYLLTEDKSVRLSFASSGQQEAVWILLQIFVMILNNTKVFLVIEEPEAHLFPVAQKDMVELISLLFNMNGNQILITTHSPYILSSFNNLLYAAQIGKNHPVEVAQKIKPEVWLPREKIGAFYLENGALRDIIDEELQLIKTEEIDYASVAINEEFNYLFDLDNE